MNRRRFLAGTAAAVGAATWRPLRSAPRRNVLVFAVDDLNHHLGCYGHPVVKSPHIDALAASGLRFDRSYCQYPVCNPSRSSLLSGLRPDATGIHNNNTRLRETLPDILTLPQHFRQAGYFTAGLGKIFHNVREHGDPASWDVCVDYGPTEAGQGGEGRNLTGGRLGWCNWRAATGTDDDQPDGRVAAHAVELLREQRDKPFFLAVGLHKPHDPFVAPARYFDLYPLDDLQPYRDPVDRTPPHPLGLPQGTKAVFDAFTDQERREFMRGYYAGVSYTDAQVGRVLAALRESGQADNTTVLFFSDHGYHLGERGWWNKVTVYELAARSPVIMAGAGVARGASTAALVEFLDFYPTLCDAAGLPRPEHLQGSSYWPVCADPARGHKQAAYTQVNRGPATVGRSVRTERWRYTEWVSSSHAAELYDHATDPGEWHNLAARPEHAATVAQHARLLREDAPAGWQLS